jgi:hypothetical protein
MSMRSFAAATTTLVAFGLAAAGCYSNVQTVFPEDFEPWEEQMSEPAPATASDPCPETLVHVESRMYNGGHTASVHGSACIHEPIATVFDAMRDPQTGRDPSVNTWTLFPEPVPEECSNGPAGLFETAINAGSPISVDFRLCWRFALVSGTEEAPTQVVSRWQKVFGTSAISTLEGSLVASQFPGDPENITIVDYQYHLTAATTGPSNYQTINEYLDVIYGRLLRRSHGEAL